MISLATPSQPSGLRSFTSPDSFRFDINELNRHLSEASAHEAIDWATEQFGNELVMTTSFGIQSAVMLHLAMSVDPNIPVIWVDTGYLPEETYRFADELTKRLNLNLKIYQSAISPARMESSYGKLWLTGNVEDLNLYDQIRKVEPMKRALEETGAQAWLTGLRSEQTKFRQALSPLSYDGDRYKLLPILDWNSRDVFKYLTKHNLPFHPLFDKGYATVGDWHSSRPLTGQDENERNSRFNGLKEECGIHLPGALTEASTIAVAA
ncbi:phosphoadenylyl-sulfate reductase [Pirellulales bacterium]|nr:phosphoadenylyl-sulfate reductase [Pirellulales bacterium]